MDINPIKAAYGTRQFDSVTKNNKRAAPEKRSAAPSEQVEISDESVKLQRLSMEKLNEIIDEVEHLCTLTFRDEELKYLAGMRFIKQDFVDFLRIFRLNRDFIDIRMNGELEIRIRGPWLHIE